MYWHMELGRVGLSSRCCGWLWRKGSTCSFRPGEHLSACSGRSSRPCLPLSTAQRSPPRCRDGVAEKARRPPRFCTHCEAKQGSELLAPLIPVEGQRECLCSHESCSWKQPPAAAKAAS